MRPLAHLDTTDRTELALCHRLAQAERHTARQGKRSRERRRKTRAETLREERTPRGLCSWGRRPCTHLGALIGRPFHSGLSTSSVCTRAHRNAQKRPETLRNVQKRPEMLRNARGVRHPANSTGPRLWRIGFEPIHTNSRGDSGRFWKGLPRLWGLPPLSVSGRIFLSRAFPRQKGLLEKRAHLLVERADQAGPVARLLPLQEEREGSAGSEQQQQSPALSVGCCCLSRKARRKKAPFQNKTKKPAPSLGCCCLSRKARHCSRAAVSSRSEVIRAHLTAIRGDEGAFNPQSEVIRATL